MALRCVYTDLDGTMLGRGASLLRDAEGNFSTLAVRALEACHRAGVEVVIKSGRRKAQVQEDARLIGQRSYIYEMGCGLVDGDEEVFLTGSLRAADGDERPRPDRALRRAAAAARDRSRAGSSRTPRGTRTAGSRICSAATSTLAEVERLFAEHGDLDLRLVDNGITERRSPELQVDEVARLPPDPAPRPARRAPSRRTCAAAGCGPRR